MVVRGVRVPVDAALGEILLLDHEVVMEEIGPDDLVVEEAMMEEVVVEEERIRGPCHF